MKISILAIIFLFMLTACSANKPCNRKDGYTVKGCKEKGSAVLGKVKDGWKELKEKIEE